MECFKPYHFFQETPGPLHQTLLARGKYRPQDWHMQEMAIPDTYQVFLIGSDWTELAYLHTRLNKTFTLQGTRGAAVNWTRSFILPRGRREDLLVTLTRNDGSTTVSRIQVQTMRPQHAQVMIQSRPGNEAPGRLEVSGWAPTSTRLTSTITSPQPPVLSPVRRSPRKEIRAPADTYTPFALSSTDNMGLSPATLAFRTQDFTDFYNKSVDTLIHINTTPLMDTQMTENLVQEYQQDMVREDRALGEPIEFIRPTVSCLLPDNISRADSLHFGQAKAQEHISKILDVTEPVMFRSMTLARNSLVSASNTSQLIQGTLKLLQNMAQDPSEDNIAQTTEKVNTLMGVALYNTNIIGEAATKQILLLNSHRVESILAESREADNTILVSQARHVASKDAFRGEYLLPDRIVDPIVLSHSKQPPEELELTPPEDTVSQEQEVEMTQSIPEVAPTQVEEQASGGEGTSRVTTRNSWRRSQGSKDTVSD